MTLNMVWILRILAAFFSDVYALRAAQAARTYYSAPVILHKVVPYHIAHQHWPSLMKTREFNSR